MTRPAISHRERVLLALDHRPTDRVPVAMVCSGLQPPARTALEEWLRRHRSLTVDAYLEPILDIDAVAPRYRGPKLGPGEDIWGVVRKPVSYGAGVYDEIAIHPLASARAVDDLERYPWPSPDVYDYDAVREGIARSHHRRDAAILVPGGNPFETAWYLRGFERILEDLLVAPELAQCLLSRVNAFFLETTRRTLEAADGRADLVFTADDIAGQGGLLFSLGLWRSHLRDHHAALNELAHSYGARVIYHSDGGVTDAIPDLIGVGVDVLQALQFDAAGMDAPAMKRLYGDRLCFQGGVSVQRTLPFGSAEDVRQEVRERIGVLGDGGGYILGPSHAIQAGTPPENVVAMFDEAVRPV